MTHRRKFLAGVGALASGSAAAVGTGAFTSASMEDRSLNVGLTDDSESRVALHAGDVPDVVENGDGELELNLAGEDGVNPNSVYTWGDNSNATEQHAFRIVNNSDRAFDDVGFSYEFEDNSWQDEQIEYVYGADPECNFIRFTVHSGNFTGEMRAPEYEYWNSEEQVNRYNDLLDSHTGIAGYFDSGESLEVVVEVNTTGENADPSQKLSGDLTISVDDPLSSE